MAKTFADLTDAQKQKFAAQLALIGLTPNDVPRTVNVDGVRGLQAADSSGPAVRVQTVKVQSLAELKRLGGVPDERYTQQGHSDAHIDYPAPLPDSRLRLLRAAGARESLQQALMPGEHQSLDQATTAFVNGDSSKVPDHLVDLVESRQFPMEVTAGAAQDLIIDKPWIISGPGVHVYTYGTITIKKGGSIVCQVPAKISAQVMTNEN